MIDASFAWITVVACVIAISALAFWTPRCRAGDPAFYLGGVLIAGCGSPTR